LETSHIYDSKFLTVRKNGKKRLLIGLFEIFEQAVEKGCFGKTDFNSAVLFFVDIKI